MKHKYILINCVLLLSFGLPSVAQNGEKHNSPARYELLRMKSLWQQSTNAAGLQLDNLINYTELEVGYNSYGGSFHRPQEGERGNNLVFAAEGATLLKDYYIWGNFNYDREEIKNAMYNASTINPFRDVPYYVADINPSRWSNQHYNLKFKATTPTFRDAISFGIEGSYKASSGAKQRDIRADVRFYTLDIKPGIVYSLNKQNSIGANFEYYGIKEHSNMSNVNIYIDQDYYEMYGLGSSRRGLGAGRSSINIGNSVGGGLQYHYRGFVDLLLSANYSKKVEEVEIDGYPLKDDAATKDNLWQLRLAIVKESNSFSHILNTEYIHKHIDGIEYVTRLSETDWEILRRDIRSKYNRKTASLSYKLVANRSKEYQWLAGVEIKYEKKDDKYLLPQSVMNYENITMGINGKKNFTLSDQLMRRLLIGAALGYNKNLSGGYEYNGTYPDYVVVTDFQQTDLNYLVSNFYFYELSAIYSRKINNKSDANIFAKANLSQIRTKDFEFKNRTHLQVSVGCNF